MKGGFSLVEILVVIFIIGVLIGILVVVAGPARKQAKEARISNDLVELQNIAEQIYLEEGNYSTLSCSGASEIKALCLDVASQGSSLTIGALYSPYQSYCAYAQLDLSTGMGFCVDSSGFAEKLSYPGLICDSRPFCLAGNCPDFNKNGVVDCSNDPNPQNYQCLPPSGTCPDMDPSTGVIDGSDICCVRKCFLLTPGQDRASYSGSCGVRPCTECPDVDGDGKMDECVAMYDVDKSGDINIGDIVKTGTMLGKSCPL